MYKSDDDDFDPEDPQGVCTPFTEEDTKRFKGYLAHWDNYFKGKNDG